MLLISARLSLIARAMPRRSSVRSAFAARRMTTRPRRYLPVSASCSTRPRFWSVASSREAAAKFIVAEKQRWDRVILKADLVAD